MSILLVFIPLIAEARFLGIFETENDREVEELTRAVQELRQEISELRQTIEELKKYETENTTDSK